MPLPYQLEMFTARGSTELAGGAAAGPHDEEEGGVVAGRSGRRR